MASERNALTCLVICPTFSGMEINEFMALVAKVAVALVVLNALDIAGRWFLIVREVLEEAREKKLKAGNTDKA